ncbi:HupE/UreJ family protein [Noviherbaspirillum galbum]|uniref:HupE/UreJ family protein n=1 Tax=Noviherbaspirillum galbum TaxID=2709383 RepID=A0A6B3SHX4_9BURK|nr:HupE/UreJ family protein [Noviherbaspirillum galbum]NEX60411.1 HupE/UreJ family protein [Noviherbaspirillum galbum]
MMRILMLCLLLCAGLAHAHKPSDSYLTLTVDGQEIRGQWDIALRDLDFAIGLDANGDAAITWGEVRAKLGEIDAYAMSRLALGTAGQSCPASVSEHLIDDHTDGAYAVLRFVARCPVPVEVLQARYSLFFDIDPQHKGLLRLAYQGTSSAGVFTPEKSSQAFTMTRPSRLTQFLEYGREGIWHIWIGFDHILFLLSLLLPAVVLRKGHAWEAVGAFRPAFMSVLKIVTAFTVAHSITLTLASLHFVSLPSRLVESTIAASVVLAALNNIFPLFRERRWAMAFVFGLIHGFGFASVLSDLGLPSDALALSLVGFNLGVEVGQLAIVAGFLPIAYLLRHTAFYRRGVLLGGSLLIAAVASAWLIERAFDLKFMPF